MKWLCLIIAVVGCRHQVVIESAPYGAEVFWKEDSLGSTPIQHNFWWYPGKRIHLNVQHYGYRSMILDVDQSISVGRVINDVFHLEGKVLLGINPRTTHTAILIPEHGPAGAWTPDDAKSFQ